MRKVKEVFAVAHKITPSVLKAVNVAGFNLGMNTGKVAGQVIFHPHVHIMPRQPLDGHFGWKTKKYNDGEKEILGEKITALLKSADIN